ncbi:hypothetical protein [Bacillus sp. JCM 19041]|uniref:hypothetical protein n=1 Tax=Bacillus sp. JCM 19041 TaxID=1460637 RepID=UPI0006D11577
MVTWDGSPFEQNKQVSEKHQEDEFIPKPDKLIDFNKRQEKKKEGNEPFWDDGNRSMGPKLPPKGRKKLGKLDQMPWTLIAAVLSAIIVGLGLGVVMYQLVVGNSSATSQVEQEVPATAVVAGAEASSFPTMHVDIVQGAAFSDKKTGEEVAAQTREGGIPAVLTTGDESQFLFVGLASDQTKAQALSELIHEKGQDVYVKTYTVDGGTPDAEGVVAAEWFTKAYAVFTSLNDVASTQLINGSQNTISEQQLDDLASKLDELTQGRDLAFSSIGDDAKPHALAMSDELSRAESLISEYNESGEAGKLWEVQQALLDSLIFYEQTIKSIRQ